jgi:hypothetical protein
MIDRKTELDIRAVKSFLEFWMKFHSIYTGLVSKEIISKDDEREFLETKCLIDGKYKNLIDSLEFKYMPHSRLTDPVSDILAMNTLSFTSENKAKKVEDNWRDSYVFLNNILERLENKKRRLEQFNPLSVYLKKIFKR